MSGLIFYLLLLMVIISSTWLHFYVNEIVTIPYMDEVFHIPQVQAYCAGNWSTWDPKITTLPGLYLVSAGILGPLQRVFGDDFGCSVFNLRFICLVFTWLNLILIYKINCLRLKGESEANRILSTLSLGLSPLMFFFSFLYYTDPASTFSVLLMHYTFLQKKHVVSPLIGILAILMRQTNIVWLIWHGCNVLWETGEDFFLKILEPKGETKSRKPSKKAQKNKNKKESSEQNSYQFNSQLNLKELQTLWPRLIKKAIPKTYMYAIVFGMFVAFIIVNEGIVLGDKEAHTAIINIPQLFYFAVFSIAIGFPALTYGAKETLEVIYNNRKTYIFWVLVGLIVVYFNTVVHPYTLADNRHYTFYMWKRLYESRPILKYLLVPVYVGFGVFVTANVKLHPCLIFTLITVIAVNLIPQKLLEFRYFILPYLMLRLHMKPSHISVLAMELIWAIILNWFTVRKYLYEPFTWSHEPDQVQRFMW